MLGIACLWVLFLVRAPNNTIHKVGDFQFDDSLDYYDYYYYYYYGN